MYIFYHTYASYCAIICVTISKNTTYADYRINNTIIASQIRSPYSVKAIEVTKPHSDYIMLARCFCICRIQVKILYLHVISIIRPYEEQDFCFFADIHNNYCVS